MNKKLGFWILTALVVGNMVGSGIFMLPRSLAEAASPAGVMLAWVLTGAGVLTVALVFGSLAVRKPDLTGGPQIYAKELFKKDSPLSLLSGFMSSWGYWIGNFAGNVAIITTFASYLSQFFPVMTSQSTLWTINGFQLKLGNLLTFLICTILLWGTHFIILRGIESAGKLNFWATLSKIIGFLLFIIAGLFAFEASNILPLDAAAPAGTERAPGILGQVNGAAVTTLWAFIGVESAVVFSSRARNQRDVKRATVLGLLIALAIYIAISTLVMGMLTQEQLIASEKPLIDAIATITGPIGANLLAGLGLISLFGSTIGWVLLSAEVPYQAAKQGLFMQKFLKENKKGIPVFSLTLSNALAQFFLFSAISNSISGAFDFVIYIATLAYLVPYLIASAFQLKLAVSGETYGSNFVSRVLDGIISSLASIYSVWVIAAGTSDLKTFLFGCLLLASGLIFYPGLKKSLLPKEKEIL